MTEWINIYWKNRDNPLVEHLRLEIRNKINGNLSRNFDVEKGGRGRIENNRFYLEFVKSPLPEEYREWEHRTRFKSIPVKVVVGIETREIRVERVRDIQLVGDTLHIKGSEKLEKTLFCYVKNNEIKCELYEIFTGERLGTGHIKFTLPGYIEEIRERGYKIINEGNNWAIFDIKPVKNIVANTIIFDSMALIYSKQLKSKVLDIRLNPS